MAAMLDFNYILIPAVVILLFALYRLIIGSERIALIGVVFTIGYTAFPILKYTNFTAYIMVPAFLISLFLFYNKPEAKEGIVLGIAYGLIALSHSTSFVFSTLTLGIVFLYMLWDKKNSDRMVLLKPMALAFFLGFIIAQLYWFKPIFVYHGYAAQNVQIWTLPDYGNETIAVRTGVNILYSHFFNTANVFNLIKSILAIYGAYLLFIKKEWKKYSFATLVFISAFLLTYSYIITMPLLGTNFVPNYCSWMYLIFGSVLLALIGLENIVNSHKKYEIVAYIIIGLLFALLMYTSYDKWYDNQWANAGRVELSPPVVSIQKYLLEKTSVNDVILSTNEISFALNAISGRKMVISRRSQNDAFMSDFDERELDAAAIFYGNNPQKKVELLRKYNVSYFYWDDNWAELEFRFQNGELVDMYDPLLVMDTQKNRARLDGDGIKYAAMNFWIDPAMRSDEIKKFDILIVSPDNYYSDGHPWDLALDPYLEKVWEYKEDGVTRAALYKVKTQ